MTKGKRMQFLRIAVVILTGLVFVVAFYSGLTVRRYTVKSVKIKAGTSVRIAQISDLHSHSYGRNQAKLLALLRREKPDCIVLTGDIVDDHAPIAGAQQLFSQIVQIAPCFYVTGNHELWRPDIEEVKDWIRGYGVTVLDHQTAELSVHGNDLLMVGLADPESVVDYPKEWVNATKTLLEQVADPPHTQEPQQIQTCSTSMFKILLCHRPELTQMYENSSCDLVFSGHAHGGQIRIPGLINGLYSINQGWIPPHAGGHYTYQNGEVNHIVSRGMSVFLFLPRIFNPPELVIANLESN